LHEPGSFVTANPPFTSLELRAACVNPVPQNGQARLSGDSSNQFTAMRVRAACRATTEARLSLTRKLPSGRQRPRRPLWVSEKPGEKTFPRIARTAMRHIVTGGKLKHRMPKHRERPNAGGAQTPV
jgi:hypothetical protein